MSNEETMNFNKYNHNERANPHPQYNSQQLYYTQYNPTNEEKWVCIFENTFQENVNSVAIRERAFNRLIFSTYIYSMDNENRQALTLFNFYAMVIHGGVLLIEASVRPLIGDTVDYCPKFKIAYKTISATGEKKQYDVRIYASMQYAYERIKLQPFIFDPISNYNVPFHLESAKSGVNMYERCQAQFNDIPNNPLLTEGELNTELSGYAIKDVSQNYGYFKAKTIAIDSTEPKIDFRYKGEQKGTLDYDPEKEGFYFLSEENETGDPYTKKIATNMSILPTKTTCGIGSPDYHWRNGYFDAISLKLYYSLNDIPTGCSLAIVNLPTYTGLAYKYGNYWYTASSNEMING